MPRAESSADFKASHAAAANRASVNTAKDTGAGTANHTAVAKTNHAAAANNADANTANDTRLSTANQTAVEKANRAATANHADVNTASDTGLDAANQRQCTANRAEADIQLRARAAREASCQIGQFEPLPLGLPLSPSSKRKVRRDRAAE